MFNRKDTLLLLLLLGPLLSTAQLAKRPLRDVQVMKQARLDTMASVINIVKGDVVADIGSGNGYNLLRLSRYFPPVKYYAEDIDSVRCNKKAFAQMIKNFNPGIPLDSFVLSYGTTRATGLPKAHFTKVLMIAVVHEFDEKEPMFADIRSILKPGGFVFIEEPLVLKPVPKDKGCNNPYLTEVALKKIIADNGLQVIEEKYINDADSNKYRKIFKCSVKVL
ncbi:class I SAM-dependent methyltransferase [Paraflavitalea soli]|uniref:Class I SAM-dependent methyltransferase n=1 Tax=Paraflavitalea soli TaxID=2315862 RepID=A0A3B7MPQ3_9BACT|nr:class I SAM-dependent methyltransferase [Paraflavitalea soli]AXY73545.1 class I SAM-dependent methyltransferase [Paraflavitalea soli]